MKKIFIVLIIILISGNAFANLTATEGLAIDLSSAGAGTDMTIAFDPTELLGSHTWGDGSTDTIVWTWNRATGTDLTMTFGDDLFTLGNSLTIVTGKNFILGTTQWNSADEIDGTKIKDADYGDIDVSAGGVWTLDTDSVADNEIDFANVTFADFDYETNWRMWHSDGSGDVTEITLGANGTFLESNGAAAAPAFRTLASGDIPDISATYEVQLDNEAGLYGVLSDVTNFLQSSDIDSVGELAGITDYETGSGALVFGTAPTFTTSIQLTGADADPAAAAGTVVYDSTIAGMSGGGLRWYDNDSVRLIVDLETDPSDDDYVVAYDADNDLFYMKADADTGGSTKWNAIGDADGVGSIDFVTYTQTIDIGVTDTGGPKSGLILDVTGLGVGTTDVIALEITTVANGDTDYIPIAIYDDSGTANNLLFQVDATGGVLTEGGITLSDSATITQSADSYITFTENGDKLEIYYDTTNVELQWSDGSLVLRGQEDGVNSLVSIMGKNAGERGQLSIWSDGQDKYLYFYHDDTDGQITTSSGDLYLTAVGGDINLGDDNLTTTGSATFVGGTITGTVDISGATVTMPKRTKNDDRFYLFNAWNPNALYDTDTQLCIEPNLPANITITEVTITLDADPTTELDWDLKWADAFIGLGTATLIVAIDTTNGTTDVDSGFSDATVVAGKCLYIEFAADPDSNIKQAIVKIRYDFD